MANGQIDDFSFNLKNLDKGLVLPPLTLNGASKKEIKVPVRSWPKGRRVALPTESIRIQRIADDPVNKQWSFQSEHFRFVSNAKLRDHAVREFAALFELTHLYARQLPFELHRFEKGGNQHLRIQLIKDYKDFIREGGLPESGGTYLSEPDIILVPFDGLGLKEGLNGYSIDSRRTNQTLTHETVHMMMRGPLLKDGWFVEGSAEYIATIPMNRNILLAEQHFNSVKKYVTSTGFKKRGGHNLGTTIKLCSLRKLMESDYDEFRKIQNSYPYSLLLFYYLAHEDREGEARGLKRYAAALNAGRSTKAARKEILAGRDYRTLGKELTDYWKENGITLQFTN